jgi:hypothetical protein
MFTKTRNDIAGYFVLSVLLVLAFLVRLLWLGNIPGVNGDEAWYGLQVIGIMPTAWHTPGGLPLNPFYIIPLWIFQRIFSPAFWVLRMPAVLAGLLLVILGFPLLRKRIGVIPAAVFVILCAGLPDLIVYSRFGWDTSETGLAMLVVFSFALSKKKWPCLIAEIAAIIIHLSNIYAVAILIAIFGIDPFVKFLDSMQGKRILAGAIAICVFLVLFVELEVKSNGILGYAINQLVSLPGWLGLISIFGDLFSGVIVYRLISTPVVGLSLAIQNAIIWIILLSIMILGCWFSIRRKDFRIIALVVGLLVSLALVRISVGNDVLLSSNRYIQYLIVPTLLMVSLSINEIFHYGYSKWLPIGLAISLSILGLISISVFYFVPLFSAGGLAESSYYTGPVEPKAAAAAIILRESQERNQTTILAENWFVDQPIEYLLARHPEFTFTQFDNSLGKPTLDLADIGYILKGGGFAVGFYGGSLNTIISQKIQDQAIGHIVVYGYANKPILIIWHKLPFPQAFTNSTLKFSPASAITYTFTGDILTSAQPGQP